MMLNFLFFTLTQTHLQDNFVVLGSRVNIEYSRHRKLQVEQRETRSHLEDRDWVCFKVWSNFCYLYCTFQCIKQLGFPRCSVWQHDHFRMVLSSQPCFPMVLSSQPCFPHQWIIMLQIMKAWLRSGNRLVLPRFLFLKTNLLITKYSISSFTRFSCCFTIASAHESCTGQFPVQKSGELSSPVLCLC